MFISTLLNGTRTVILTLALVLSGMVLFTACNQTETKKENVVEVTATHNAEENKHLFEVSAREISNGWTTFKFNNASPYDHFFLIWQIPKEGIEAADAAGEPLLDHFYQSITEPFQMEFNPYIEGDIEFDEFTNNLVAAISESAPWFFEPGAKTMGGPGFTAASETSKTTVRLEPGEYIVECYVKNEEEVFHSYIGMLEHITVTEDSSDAREPKPTNRVTISSSDGIQVDQPLTKGSHTIEIHFEDQQPYAHLQGHNVQLVKLTDKDDEELLNNLAVWMDWRQAGSLVNRAPEGAEFMGGTMEMTEGQSAYFHVDLQPGDYAWIAEVPNAAEHNMLKTFVITEESVSEN